MNGVLLAVDFENKKLLKNQQQNSDKKKKGFYRAKKKICDGDVTIFQTANSGGIWHMRTYIATEEKYFQKSLRTKDIDSAIDRAKRNWWKIASLQDEGKAVFSPTVYTAVEQYLKYRYETDVLLDRITKGRFSTIKTHMNWFKKYVNAEYRLDTLTEEALVGYQSFRRDKNATDTTIRNEQATINHFCKWAKLKGLHHIEKYVFPIISIKGDDRAKIRRSTFTNEEYEKCYTDLRTWCSKAQKKKDIATMSEIALRSDEKLFNRDLFRHWFLIQANTMMRNGELFGLKWKNVKTYTAKSGERLAEITVEGHTSKVRKSRVFVALGGQYFDRLKKLSKHTKNEDFVFTLDNGTHWNKGHRKALDYQFHSLMKRVGITDYKERKLSLYSLRHFGITQRLQNGVTNLVQFADDCGTSVEHITKTYYHSNLKTSEQNALIRKEK